MNLQIASLILAYTSLVHSRKASLHIPHTIPHDSSHPPIYIDPDFPGLAFEQASLVSYATNRDGSPNTFSKNLIRSIFDRTGGKPIIRLGGTSADYGHYLPGQTTPALPRAEVYTYQDIGGTTIGPSYWALTGVFPEARWIVQLPMAIRNISETVAWAESAAEIIGIDKIEAFEPGNEADLYADPRHGPPEYQGHLSNESYVGNFTEYAAAVASAVKLPDGPFFEAFDTSVHLVHPERDASAFHVPTCFDLGINRDNIVKSVAQHYYQTNGGGPKDLAKGLMNHPAIASHMDVYRPAIAYLAEKHPHIPFIISEIGNSLNPTHNYAYQATLGSALWQVDFQLYGLSIGVRRFNFQQIMHSGFDLWLPVPSGSSPPQVFSNYYAQPFVADVVGTSGKAQVTHLPIKDAGDNVVAYGAYEDGELMRAAVIDFDYWSATDSPDPRLSTVIRMGVPRGIHSVRVERLASPMGAGGQADSMTYGGSKWTYQSEGKEVKGVVNDTRVLKVVGGHVRVEVLESEALLLHFDWSEDGDVRGARD